MTIRVWHSYSCNNSSLHRLVARFADAARAKVIAAELAELLRGLGDGHRDSGLQAMARLYGFDWEDDGWGSEEDGPHVIVDDTLLVVHHDYCVGLGPGIPAYLTEQGAKVEQEAWADIHASLLFRPSGDPRLVEELDALIGQEVDAEGSIATFQAPWAKQHTRGKLAWFRDPNTVGVVFPIDARDLVHLRAWVAERGIEPILQIENPEDAPLFTALSRARCTACEGPLEYLDPRLHDIEAPQLVCKPCGGLYELGAFL